MLAAVRQCVAPDRAAPRSSCCSLCPPTAAYAHPQHRSAALRLTSSKMSCYDDYLPMTIKLKTWLRLRGAISALALAMGWLSVPFSLASREPDVCEMECCVSEGHCCCAARKPFVKGHVPGADGR